MSNTIQQILYILSNILFIIENMIQNENNEINSENSTIHSDNATQIQYNSDYDFDDLLNNDNNGNLETI